MSELVKDISIETTTDSQRAIDGMAAGDHDKARATPAEAFDGFSQSADGHTLSYENPQGSERSGLLERLAELESGEAAPPVDAELSEPESAAETLEGSKTLRQMAQEQAARHQQEIIEESHRLQMTREFGGQWIEEGRAQFTQRVDELTATIPDFRQTMAANKSMIEAIEARPEIALAVNYIRGGADVAYHLATHPDQAKQLLQMPDSLAVARVGQLAAELYSPHVARRSSSAPAPFTPLRGTSKSALPLDQADYQTSVLSKLAEAPAQRH